MPRSQSGLARLIQREPLKDPRVAAAFAEIARADFVPRGSEAEAYSDRPVTLPESQTTSQPSLIARMIDAAAPRPDDRVLEVGSGYGFQTALLARLAREVVSVERVEKLALAARENLERAGIHNAEVIVGDGWQGCPERAPFDVIIVSAAADGFPDPLGRQLAEGGRLVIPLKSGLSDDVWLYEKRGDSVERVRLVTPARFVPLIPGVVREDG